MGAEAVCAVRFNGKRRTGKARPETDDLQFLGGDVRLAIPFAQISALPAAITAVGGKMVRFASTHTAYKFVITVSKRDPAHE